MRGGFVLLVNGLWIAPLQDDDASDKTRIIVGDHLNRDIEGPSILRKLLLYSLIIKKRT